MLVNISCFVASRQPIILGNYFLIRHCCARTKALKSNTAENWTPGAVQAGMQFLSFYLDLSCSMLSRSLARVSDVPRVVFICCFCVRCLLWSCVLCGQKAENAKWEETRRRERWDTLFLAVVESQPRSQGLSSSRQKQPIQETVFF